MSKKNRKVGWVIPVLVASLAGLPLASVAAGLGKLTVLSSLGQPLRAELDVSASRDELSGLNARIAGQEAFRQANIEYSGIFPTLRFSLDKRPNGQPYFRITTERAVSDPFLDILVELSWSSGRLVREYTFLLDPPEYAKAVEPPVPVAAPVVSSPVRQEMVKVEAEKPAGTEKTASAEKPAQVKAAPEKSKSIAPVAAPTPAPAPKVVDSEQAKPAVTADTRLVKRGETLGKIAAETKPDGVNLDQMLVALFRNNQDAFDGRNINRLKSGKILSVPDQQSVAAIPASEARQVIVAHAADFDAYRRKLAGAAANAPAAAEAPSVQASSGKITPKVEDKVAVAPAKDKLQVSRTETGTAGAAATAAAKAKAAEEDRIAREKSLKEAQSRVAELEKNLAEMRRLAELKSQAAAELQKQAAAKAEVKKPESPAPVVPPKPAEPPKPVEPPKPAEPVKPVEPPKPVEQPTAPPAPVATPPAPPAEPPKPVEPPKPKKVVVPPPEPVEPSFMEENGLLVYSGGGVLALLLGFLGFKALKRRRTDGNDAAPPSAAESALSGTSAFSATPSLVDSDATGQVSEFGDLVDGFGAGEGVDPIREAETYMAYGRDVQAEEILLDALKKDPTRIPVQVKLLEVYAARKSIPQFNTLAVELHNQTGGAGPDWEKVVALGSDVDPSNALYRPSARDDLSPAPIAPLSALDMTAAAEESFAQKASRTVIIPAPGGTAAAVEAMAVPRAEEDEAPAISVPDASMSAPTEIALDDSSLDFDLDLGDSSAEAAPELIAPAEVADLDFDLDLGGETSAPEISATDMDLSVPQAAAALDFDLNLDSSASSTSEEVDGNSVDFELASTDITGGLAAPEPIVESAPAPALDFDFDLGSPSAGSSADEEDFTGDATLVAPMDLRPNAAQPAVVEEEFSGDATLVAPIDIRPGVTAATVQDRPFSPESTLVEPMVIEKEVPATPPVLDIGSIDLELPSDDDAMASTLITPINIDGKSVPEAKDAGGAEDNPEVATKIELAQAYEEMGDKEGAKELLLEVLNEGSASQQDLARSRLSRLG